MIDYSLHEYHTAKDNQYWGQHYETFALYLCLYGLSVMSKVMPTPKYFFSVSRISCSSKNSCSNDSVTEICIPVIENIRWKHYQIID